MMTLRFEFEFSLLIQASGCLYSWGGGVVVSPAIFLVAGFGRAEHVRAVQGTAEQGKAACRYIFFNYGIYFCCLVFVFNLGS